MTRDEWVWGWLLHAETQFNNRTNFFLVAESLAAVAYASLTATRHQIAVRTVLVIFGIAVTVIWLWVQLRSYQDNKRLLHELADPALPAYARFRVNRPRPSQTIVLALALPIVALAMWIFLLLLLHLPRTVAGRGIWMGNQDLWISGSIGIVGTLVGVVATSWLQRSAQKLEWRRQDASSRRHLYVDFGVACMQGLNFLGQLVSPRDWKTFRLQLVERQERIVNSGTWLNVVASDAVKDAADELSRAVILAIERLSELHMKRAATLAGSFTTINITDDEVFRERRNHASDAYQAFIAAIRAEGVDANGIA